MDTTSSARLCRLCLEAMFGSDNLLNIFDDEGSTIASILTKHFWFEANKYDGMSEWLCEICWIQTKTFHHFYKRVESRHANQRKTNELGSSVSVPIKEERSDSPIEETCEPDLNIVKCEETELTEVGEIIDYRSEVSETSDDDQQPSNKKCKNDEDSSTTNNPAVDTKHNSRTASDEQDEQIRKFFTMQCDLCANIEFQTLSDAQIHYRNVHNTRGYLMCCGKKYTYRYNILGHIQHHTDPIALRCDQCGKSFLDKRALKNHIQNVHSAENFPCDKCDKMFRTHLSLNNHIRDTHYQQLYELVCDICFRGFSRKNLLLNHIAFEHPTIAVPKAQCSICGEWLAHERALQLHLRINHQDANFEVHVCVICNKVERSKESLAGHIRSVHPSVKPS